MLIARSNREARAFARTEEAAADIEVRAFAAPIGVEEDPVTGSFNASLAQWLIAADGQVWVGGDSVTCIDGTVML